jgi:hypothetical protein
VGSARRRAEQHRGAKAARGDPGTRFNAFYEPCLCKNYLDCQVKLGTRIGNVETRGRLCGIQARLRTNASFGAKQLERGYATSTDDKVGEAENGGVWHALNYPLAWALHLIDPEVGLDEFKRNSMAVHAELFPEQANGIWTASDFSTSTLAAQGFGETGVLCMHRHAWPLFAALRILGGVEFDAGGVSITPHPVIVGGKFSLHTPLVSVSHDGAGRWSGHYSPSKASGARWLVRLLLRGKDGSEDIAASVRTGGTNGTWSWGGED